MIKSTLAPAVRLQLARQLPRVVSAGLEGVPAELIDDACQTAWDRFLSRGQGVAAGSELGWLVTVATRIAFRLLHADNRDLSYEQERERALAGRPEAEPGPERSAELRERLDQVRRLPVRQRRILLMHGYGYRYCEIARLTGDSRRTVERQLRRARRMLAA